MDALGPDDPQWVGPYRLDGRLGEGGMGSVFLGTSPGGRKVAVKLIKRELAATPQFRQRFAREVDAARRVGGFHTAQVVDADPGAECPWLVTAFIPGPTLHDVVADDGPLDAAAVLRLGAGLAEGLAAIHKCGLVHRDLKPGNVILAADGPRIIDFGIARAVDASSLTATGTIIGTYSYMSPEQIRADRAGAASDVFSLGSVLAFAATGRGPFDAPTLIEVVQRILGEPPALDGVDDGALRELLLACLAKEPGARPAVDGLAARFAAGADGDGGGGGSAVVGSGPVGPGPARSGPVGSEPVGAAAAPGPAGPGPAAPGPAGPRPVDPRVPMTAAGTPAAAPAAAAAAAAAAPPLMTHPPTVAARPGPPPTPPGSGPGSTTADAGDSPRTGGLSRRTLLFAGLGTAAAATAVGLPLLLRGGKADGSSATRTRPGSPSGTAKPEKTEKYTRLKGLPAVRALAFGKDGKQLYGTGHNTIWRWDPNTGEGTPVRIGTPGYLQPAVFSRDLGLLVRAEENKVRVWDTATGKTVHTFTLPTEQGPTQKGWPTGLAISAGGDMLAANTSDGLHLWELPSGKEKGTFTNASSGPVAISGDSRTLVAGQPLKTLTAAGEDTATVKASGGASAVVLSPDGSLLAFGTSGGHVAVWNVESRSEVVRFEGLGSLMALAFHPGGRLLVGGGSGPTARVWDTLAGKEVGSLKCPNSVEAIAVSPDGRSVAIGLSMAIDYDAKDAVLLWRLP
ncbi:WD40 repeat domain-containing serine/threonine protein kinase [Streptomyces albireticuli]|nr:serine/threonine-protein kinase [Streptomyces albireticuli]MCD9144385.1 serine/threonine-protein kinase [Streptomyces albireticuli]MCD9163552.1 serine/threonine-protein kinase [Streptomyces albireticuli]MCD9193062.1 serine/threonine-protein kinase [Streptomyces albireticuli]